MDIPGCVFAAAVVPVLCVLRRRDAIRRMLVRIGCSESEAASVMVRHRWRTVWRIHRDVLSLPAHTWPRAAGALASRFYICRLTKDPWEMFMSPARPRMLLGSRQHSAVPQLYPAGVQQQQKTYEEYHNSSSTADSSQPAGRG